MKLKIELKKDGYLINGKYFIDQDGVIWYDLDYIGNRKRDFPSYLFELAKLVTRSKNYVENN